LVYATLVSCASEPEEEPFEGDLVGHLFPNPMFSAYDGVHEYAVTPSVPGAVNNKGDRGGDILASSLKWDFDSSFVSLGEFSDLPHSIKLTTKRAGTTVVTLTATHTYGGLFRQRAALTISRANVEEWNVGDKVYREGALTSTADLDAGLPDIECAGLEKLRSSTVACVDCHSSSDQNDTYAECTPVQTAGHSNSQLIDLIVAGKQPPGGTFNSCLGAEPNPDAIYHSFHRFDLSDEEKRGIVWKLRSLPPKYRRESSGRMSSAAVDGQ
jgi:hypothetical protein